MSNHTSTRPMDRRAFLKRAGMAAAVMGAGAASVLGQDQPAKPVSNSIPRWRGFNMTDFSSTRPIRRYRTSKEELQWMVDWGFDFVRLPIAYPCYVDFDRSRSIRPEEVCNINERAVDRIDALVSMAHEYGLHVSLNLHRAPGYCINAGFQEPFDLWRSEDAQEAFYFHWGMWAKRYKNVSRAKISFDLLNEPALRSDINIQHATNKPVPGPLYRKVAQKAVATIRAANPDRLIIADGNNVGNDVIPEIEDLNIAQSCRGYFPHYISHHKAPWAMKDPDSAPKPVWPGEMDGEYYDRKRLEEYYQPWIDLVGRGVGVHCGECGCWIKTPHTVFLAWFRDVLEILKAHQIGFALWNFRGTFGILDSQRTDVDYDDWHGHKLDSQLLELLREH